MASAATTAFARRLRELRLAKGFARARYFAEALGISENRYTRYERGGAEPEFDLILQICDVLGVTPNELFAFEAPSTAAGASQPSPGFSETETWPEESAAGERSARAQAHGADESTSVPSAALHPADRLGWRLAEQIARAQIGDQDRSRPLEELRRAGELFVELRSEPFGAVARMLADPALAHQSEKAKTKLGREIKRYLRAVEQETGSRRRPRS